MQYNEIRGDALKRRWCINNDKAKKPLPKKLREKLSLLDRKYFVSDQYAGFHGIVIPSTRLVPKL